MATTLTAEQLETVQFSSQGGRYTRDAWDKYVEDAAKRITKDKIGLGGVEQDFPGVKPAHVRHMLRIVLKEKPELAKVVAVGWSKEHGVVLKPAA